MTRERFNEIRDGWEKAVIRDRPPFADETSLALWGETLGWLGDALAKLDAWESNGLTEEMLRDHEGHLKLNRGVTLISQQYLEELQSERDAAIGQRDEVAKRVRELEHTASERDALKAHMKSVYKELNALKQTYADKQAEVDRLKKSIAWAQ